MVFENNESFLVTTIQPFTNTSDADTVNDNGPAFRTIKLILYALIFIISIAGNLLVVCTIVKFKRQRTFPNVFVLNLSLCDILLVTLSIPVAITNDETGEFYFGRIGCWVLWPFATLVMNSAVLTLLAIACERYVAVVHPFSFALTRRKIIAVLTLVHVVSLLSVLPYAGHLTLISGANKPSCRETWSRTSRKIYTLFLFLLQYGIPLPLMIGLSTIAWNKIRSQNAAVIRRTEAHAAALTSYKSRSQFSDRNSVSLSPAKNTNYRPEVVRRLKRRLSFVRPQKVFRNESSLERYNQTKRTLQMFIVVVAVFATCMLPSQVIWLWTDFATDEGPSTIMVTVFYFMTYTNSVLNPWIYGGVNSSFRKAYRQMLIGKRCRSVNRRLSVKRRNATDCTKAVLMPLVECATDDARKNNDFEWIYDTWKSSHHNACALLDSDHSNNNQSHMGKNLTLNGGGDQSTESFSAENELTESVLENVEGMNETVV